MKFDQASLQTRLNLMADYLTELSLLKDLSVDEVCNDIFKYRTAERLQELIIQASIDINRHLLIKIHQISPDTNSAVFIMVGKVGILSQELSERLIEAGKFRNLLAHHYEKIDARMVASNIQLVLGDYKQYMEQINLYLITLGESHAEP